MALALLLAMRTFTPVFVCLLAACSPPTAQPGQGPPNDTAPEPGADVFEFSGSRPRNLLVLSLDTTRRSALTRYRDDAGPMPFLDALAAEGVALDAHASCSAWTLPGAICAMTGSRPDELGLAPRVASADAELEPIPEGTPTLATRLSSQGYTTALVTANRYLGPAFLGEVDHSVVTGQGAEGVVRVGVDMLDESLSADAPWTLHLHFLDPHAPYDPPEGYATALEGRPTQPWDLRTTEGARALAGEWSGLDDAAQAEALTQLQILYDGELSYVDDQIAALFAALDQRGQLDDTLVLVWTDHGEQLFEHGGLGHTITLYAGENDGVALWWARGMKPAAVSTLTTNEDLVPSTLAALGLPVPTDVSGRFVGERRVRMSWLWPRDADPLASVQQGDLQVIYNWDGRKLLFDRAADPGQRVNRYSAEPAAAKELWETLLPMVRDIEALTGATASEAGL